MTELLHGIKLNSDLLDDEMGEVHILRDILLKNIRIPSYNRFTNFYLSPIVCSKIVMEQEQFQLKMQHACNYEQLY